jgi:hypothetical protein
MFDFVFMASQRIALRLPSNLYQLPESHIDNTGVTVTGAVTAAIAAYFGAEDLMPLSERVSQLEKRLAALEKG